MRGFLLVAITACGRLGFDPTGSQDASSGPNGTMHADAAFVGVGGGGSITGLAPDGTPFTMLAAAYIVGHPQYPGVSIYLLSTPIACSSLGSPGWDHRITAGTQVLDLLRSDATVGSYPIATSNPPASNNSYSLYTRVIGGGTVRANANGGTLQVIGVGGEGSIDGTFMITWGGANTLTGVFEAVPCPTGYSP
jgi:hypothetical protein